MKNATSKCCVTKMTRGESVCVSSKRGKREREKEAENFMSCDRERRRGLQV